MGSGDMDVRTLKTRINDDRNALRDKTAELKTAEASGDTAKIGVLKQDIQRINSRLTNSYKTLDGYANDTSNRDKAHAAMMLRNAYQRQDANDESIRQHAQDMERNKRVLHNNLANERNAVLRQQLDDKVAHGAFDNIFVATTKNVGGKLYNRFNNTEVGGRVVSRISDNQQ